MPADRLTFSNHTHIGVADDHGAGVVPVDHLRRRFGVADLIRLHEADFALLARVGPCFVHFNLAATTNQLWQRYALVPIVKPGERTANGEEVLPVVDPRRYRLATCTGVVQHVPLDQVTADQFACSLPTIRNVDALRAALLARYRGLFPGLTDPEIVARGCAVTSLDLDEPSVPV